MKDCVKRLESTLICTTLAWKNTKMFIWVVTHGKRLLKTAFESNACVCIQVKWSILPKAVRSTVRVHERSRKKKKYSQGLRLQLELIPFLCITHWHYSTEWIFQHYPEHCISIHFMSLAFQAFVGNFAKTVGVKIVQCELGIRVISHRRCFCAPLC